LVNSYPRIGKVLLDVMANRLYMVAIVMQGELFKKRGGKREGAGRKPGPGGRRGWVRKRPAHSKHTPVHVTLRVVKAVGGLRRRRAYHAVRRALQKSFWRGDFRVVHVSIQRTHIHLICEADDARALTRGLQGFQISAARRLNSAITVDRKLPTARKGVVFPQRYHAEVLSSPRQTRNAINYVLNNWRHHNEDLTRAPLDAYASGIFFDGWNGYGPYRPPDGYDPLPALYPHTWLLSEGWRKRGLIDPYATPA
jgi:REP element-mobilizing transposase RayT